jgi:hypothetical protein
MPRASKLRRGEICPIHKSYFCCGRENKDFRRKVGFVFLKDQKTMSAIRWEPVGPGVWRIVDPHHPRGFRERRSRSAMRILLHQKIAEQNRCCAICHKEFTDYSEIVAEHREPCGMGGARRDDHPDNIQAAHNFPCNVNKGSRRIAS